MNLVLIGVNHKSAPLEVRERLAIPSTRWEEATLLSACLVFARA